MGILRNVAGQKWRVYAWDTATGAPKTGDAANISGKINKDDAGSATTNDTAPTEVDSTNEPGFYEFDLTQAETSAAKLSLGCKSSTSGVSVLACPPVQYTIPQYASLEAIDSSGKTAVADTQKVDVNTIKTQTVTCGAGVTVSPFVGSTGAAINGTNANTLSSHDPGATLGTSTLTQTQVTGGAYALNSASFAFNSGLDLTTTQKASVNAEADTALADAKAGYAIAIEAAILDEGDATALLAAIAAKIEEFLINEGDATATLASIGAAVRTALATELARIDVAISTRASSSALTTAQNDLDILTGVDGVILAANQPNYVPATSSQAVAIKDKTDNLPSDPADASVIAARFDTLDASVADLPTNAELATALGTADDAVLEAIAALNNLSSAQVTAAVLAMAYEGSETFQAFLRLARASLVGKSDGFPDGPAHFRDAADTKNRITATIDADGNRTAITTDAT